MSNNSLRAHIIAVVTAVLIVASPPAAHAIIVMGSQGNNFDSANPDPNGLDQFEGSLGSAVGTPISSTYFITAYHIGQGSGDNFTFNNHNYTVDFVSEVGDSDLAVWKIANSSPTSTFAFWAPLETSAPSTSGSGAPMVVFGEGPIRGSAVTGGWEWGSPSNDSLSWGTNNVTQILANADPGNVNHNAGNYLRYFFTRTTDGGGNVTDPNEAILSTGNGGEDSGGGLFIQNPTTHVWELAGVNYSVDDYSTTSGGSAANDALYNSTGYFGPNNVNGQNTAPESGPESSYDSAIYSNYAAIAAIVPLPEPTSGLLLLSALYPMLAARAFRRSK